jgi:hypothetical protein
MDSGLMLRTPGMTNVEFAVIASEAKQSMEPRGKMDSFVAIAPRNDELNVFAAIFAIRFAATSRTEPA